MFWWNTKEQKPVWPQQIFQQLEPQTFWMMAGFGGMSGALILRAMLRMALRSPLTPFLATGLASGSAATQIDINKNLYQGPKI